MFRRHRSVSAAGRTPQYAASTPTSPAALAASQAFLANRASNSNLSAAAASTALRTMSPSPTPVSQVQTRRMQRKASNASITAQGRGRGGLARQNSSGSMTERTFRAASPATPASPIRAIDPPPVPKVPRGLVGPPTTLPKTARRSVSLDVAPRRPMSPLQATAPITPQSAALKAAAIAAQRPQNLERTGSQNSINFSYPRPQSPDARPQSPVGKSAMRPMSPVQSPARSAISASETRNIQRNLDQAANQPVKKKKKKPAETGTEGSHLSTGTMAPTKSAVVTREPVVERDSSVEAEKRARPRKKKDVVGGEASHFPPSPPYYGGSSDDDSAAERTKERRAKRAQGILIKQPSVVREDWEGEIKASSPTTAEHPQTDVAGDKPKDEVVTPAPVSKRIAMMKDEETPAQNHVSPTTEQSQSKTTPSALNVPNDAKVARNASVSPSRGARFSQRLSADTSTLKKHEPLPRSVSPAKPALKHYSPVVAATTDIRPRNSSIPPSDVSDTSVSNDGLKKKKSVRVSFEQEPEIVGKGAGTDFESPVIHSPQNKDGSKKVWPAPSPLKPKPVYNPITSENDEQQGMSPRPALPSFGSLRDKNRKPGDPIQYQPPVEDIEGSSVYSSSASSSINLPTETVVPTSTSVPSPSDQAGGAVLAQDAEKKSPMSMFYNQAVTQSNGVKSTPTKTAKVEDVKPAAVTNKVPLDSIPSVAVMPPSPPLSSDSFPDQFQSAAPGRFSSTQGQEGAKQVSIYAEDPEDDAEPIAGQAGYRTQLGVIEESDTESVYADAPEATADGDGFGSINAIIKTPMKPSPIKGIGTTQDVPSSKQSPVKEQSSWEQTQAHWKGIAQQTRQAGNAAPPSPTPATVSPVATETTISKAAPSGAKVSAGALAAAKLAPSAGNKTIQDQSTSTQKSKPQQNRRSEPVQTTAPATRTSMRGNAPAQAASVQDGNSQSTFTKSLRNSADVRSTGTPTKQTPERLTASHQRTAVQKKNAVTAIPPPTMSARTTRPPPKYSNDSDSESSFRKARRTKAAANGGAFAMRRSLREGPPAAAPSPAVSGRGGVRSMSPNNRRPLSPSGFRTSLRTNQDTPPTRPEMERRRSSSLFRFTSLKRDKSPVDDHRSKNKVYKSRFEDSSDEEPERNRFTPVRGIPRKANDAESTDLEDSSDEERRPKPPKNQHLRIAMPPQTFEAASDYGTPPMSPNTAKKRGFLGMFKGKKRDDDDDMDTPESGNYIRDHSRPTTATNEVIKPANLGFSSAAERDEVIRQTLAKLEGRRDQSREPTQRNRASMLREPNDIAVVAQTTGRLQKRQQPQRVMSDSWPLPPQIPTENDHRPTTADGYDSRVDGYGSKMPQKKKRFSALRKAFGLSR